MRIKGKEYSPEFKKAAVQQLETGRTAAEVARAVSVDPKTVSRWCRLFLAGELGDWRPDVTKLKPPPRKFTPEQKQAAVREVEAGKSMAQIARDNLVAASFLTRWCAQYASPDSEIRQRSV